MSDRKKKSPKMALADLIDFAHVSDDAPVDAEAELRSAGVDISAFMAKVHEGIARVEEVEEEERLSWQRQAQERRAQLQARASTAASRLPTDMDRKAMLVRLDELRAADPSVGTAIKMAARKRKPEESTEDELRALLEEMEALRAIEGNDQE